MGAGMTELETPSSQLAKILVDRLIEKKLLRADKREQLVTKIAAGTMKGEDWKLDIELAIAKSEQP
ncbi:hypothetical protein GCM10010909_33830 [Acidocella aquatica]|uniref:Uncharacterized protein n=2 Tax=Acidocella aquatica TaxID=1922313 RepID=A0ABQ6AD33_9PROT|nr:hypothetical protein GCM10010909_33830 [Acidocella aquatica]